MNTIPPKSNNPELFFDERPFENQDSEKDNQPITTDEKVTVELSKPKSHFVIDTRGKDGINAGNIFAKLYTLGNLIKIGYDDNSETFPLGSLKSIDLIAEGGRAKDGDGGKGRSITNLEKDLMLINAEGVDGGNGGSIMIFTKERDKDLLMLIDKVRKLGGAASRKGREGLKGSFHFCVEAEDGKTFTYKKPYRLMATFGYVDKSDDYYEPGEKVSVRIDFQNICRMSTPSNSDISVEGKPTSWIEPLERTLLPRTMHKGDIYTREIKLRITDYDKVAVGKPFKIDAVLTPRVTMLRVDKSLKEFEWMHKRLNICYPVELHKSIKGVPTITTNDEAPIGFLANNISKFSLGIEGEKSRLIRCSISPKNAHQNSLVVIRDRKGNINHDQPWRKDWNIDLLKRGWQPLSATVSFVGDGIPLYTKVMLIARLQIGTLTSPLDEVKTIQERNFTLQLGEGYQYNPEAQFLIVTNVNTSGDEVQAWRNILQKVFDSEVMVWNTSIYNGFSLMNKKKDKVSLMDQIRGKTLIILNYNSNNNDKGRQTTASQIPHGELFCAAKEAGIKTLLVGSKERLEDFAQPPLDKTTELTHKNSAAFFQFLKEKDHSEETYQARLHKFPIEGTSSKKSSQAKLIRKVEKLAEKLHKKYPWKQFHLNYEVPVEPLSTVTIAEGLTPLEASLVQIDASGGQSLDFIETERTLFAISKAVGFNQRLKRYPDIDAQSDRKVIAKSILSDICDEFYALIQKPRKWGQKRAKLQKYLPKLKELTTILKSSSTDKKEIYQELYGIFLQSHMIMKKICSWKKGNPLQSAVNSIYKELQVYYKEKSITVDRSLIKNEVKHFTHLTKGKKNAKVLEFFRRPFHGEVGCNNLNTNPRFVYISTLEWPNQKPLEIREPGIFSSEFERNTAINALESKLYRAAIRPKM